MVSMLLILYSSRESSHCTPRNSSDNMKWGDVYTEVIQCLFYLHIENDTQTYHLISPPPSVLPKFTHTHTHTRTHARTHARTAHARTHARTHTHIYLFSTLVASTLCRSVSVMALFKKNRCIIISISISIFYFFL